MLRSAMSAFTRVFDALWFAAWCAADPGPMPPQRKYGSRLCGAACTASGTPMGQVVFADVVLSALLVERYADPVCPAPHDVAGQLQPVAWHNQYESRRNAGLAFDLDRRAGSGYVADSAI